ncbi:MAG: hypothetical protein ACRDNL_18195 [Spirillospora sp.]
MPHVQKNLALAKGIRAVAAAALALAATGALTTASANADEPAPAQPRSATADDFVYDESTSDSAPAGGRVFFQPIGDRVQLCDMEEDDGSYTKLSVWDVSPERDVPYGVISNRSSQPTCTPLGKDLPEGHCISFHIFLVLGDGTIYGGRTVRWRNVNYETSRC